MAGTSQVVVTNGQLGNVFGGGNGNYTYSGELAGLTPPYCHETYVNLPGGTINNAYAGGYAGECGSTHLVVGEEEYEKEKEYPEATMWGNLPAKGFYMRHTRNIHFDDITVMTEEDDVRPEFVTEE